MNASMKHSLVAAGALAVLLATWAGAAAQGVPAEPPGAHGAEVTLVFQPGDESPYSANYDWRLIQKYPLMNGTFWTEYVHVGRDLSDATEHRLVVNVPDIIGNEPGQVPIGATITKATIQVLATQAQNVPIAVRTILEQNLGEAGRTLGKAECTAPGWQYRTYDTAWSQPGAGWPLSSAATPLDTKAVTQSYSWVEFDITAAVQSWALDPSSNHGLLFAAADLSVPGQSFKGGCAEDAHRPIVTVTYLDVADLVGPALAITTPASSHCLSAFVEGTCGPDAVDVEMTVNGEPYTVERANRARWHCEVPLQAEAPTVVRVVARDALGNETWAGQHLRCAPADPFAADSLLLAVGDMIHMRVNTPGPLVKWVEYDAGQGLSPDLQPAGKPSLAIWYCEPGVYQATATLYDANFVPLGQDGMTVTVVEVASAGSIVAQAGFLREIAFDVLPESAAAEVSLGASDPSLLHLGAQSIANGTIAATLAHVGNHAQDAALELRLGGPDKRIIATRPVLPFYIEHQPLAADGASSFDFTVRVVPHDVLDVAPQLQFEVCLLSNGAAFPAELDPDGDKAIMVGTDKFDEGCLTLPASQDWSLSTQFSRGITGYDFPGSGGTFGAAPPAAGKPVTAKTKKNGSNKAGSTLEIIGPDSLLVLKEGEWTGKVTLAPGDSLKSTPGWNWTWLDPGPTLTQGGTGNAKETYKKGIKSTGTYTLQVSVQAKSGALTATTPVVVYFGINIITYNKAPDGPDQKEQVSAPVRVEGMTSEVILKINKDYPLVPQWIEGPAVVKDELIKTKNLKHDFTERHLQLGMEIKRRGTQAGEHQIALYARRVFYIHSGKYKLVDQNGKTLDEGDYKAKTGPEQVENPYVIWHEKCPADVP